jgi:PAS domain S-box-containing protein
VKCIAKKVVGVGRDRETGNSAVYRELIDGSLQGILVFQDLKAVLVNQSFVDTMGFSSIEEVLQAKDILQLLPSGNRQKAAAKIAVGLAEETQPKHFRSTAYKQSGEKIWLDNMIKVVTWNGRPAIQIIIVDISEQMKAELQLVIAKEQAEAANRVKSDFLSNMSHELRTPLNAIIGFTDLLRYDTSQPLTDDQDDSMGQVSTAAHHLLDIVNDVLDLTLLETGKLRVDITEISLLALLEESAAFVRTKAQSERITLKIDVAKELIVFADYTRLKQVARNLLTNAVMYNSPGGSVTISIDQHLTGFIGIKISDTGAGIAEEHLDDLFQPFNRLGFENSGTDGTGVGLAISNNLVEAMSGNIAVETILGTGTTFTVFLPDHIDSILT